MNSRLAAMVIVTVIATGCSDPEGALLPPTGAPASSPDAGTPAPPPPEGPGPYAFPVDAAQQAQQAKVCARGNSDAIARSLCATPPPRIGSLVHLHRALRLDDDAELGRGFAFNANSTSVVARQSTVLNPRVIVYSRELDPGKKRAVGFVRGEQLVELVGLDAGGQLNFYILRFEQACNRTPKGCGLADLLTPSLESDWTGWSLYQDTDLINTPLDCLVCHQPGGPSARRHLRMQELRAPWLHWFPGNAMGATESETMLTANFLQAHAGEQRYGGVPLSQVSSTDPQTGAPGLESFVNAQSVIDHPDHPGGDATDADTQAFSSAAVLAERDQGSRATWERYQEEAKRGLRLPIPFYDVDTSDPALRSAAVAAYRSVVFERASPASLLDLREIFRPEARTSLSFEAGEGEDGATLLTHYCARCHNHTLDQTLSRARFDATRLSEMSEGEKTLAIERLNLPTTSPWVMPPARFAQLSPASREVLTTFLKR